MRGCVALLEFARVLREIKDSVVSSAAIINKNNTHIALTLIADDLQPQFVEGLHLAAVDACHAPAFFNACPLRLSGGRSLGKLR